MKNKKNILEGIFSKKDKISPAYISTKNPKYLEIDNIFYGGFLIVNYNRENTDLILKKIINSNINMNISIFYEKQDAYKVIRNLSYHIANIGVDLKDGKTNPIEEDIAAFTYNDAKYIRKEIQVNNEDLYFLCIYINVYSKDKKELEYIINQVEGILQSKNMQIKQAYFRQENGLLSSFPFMKNDKIIKNISKRNVLTSGLIGTYPFISSSIFDEDGILIGSNIYNNSLVQNYMDIYYITRLLILFFFVFHQENEVCLSLLFLL